MRNITDIKDWKWNEETEAYWDLYPHAFTKYFMLNWWIYKIDKKISEVFLPKRKVQAT